MYSKFLCQLSLVLPLTTAVIFEFTNHKPAMGVVMLEDGMVEFVDYDPAQVYQDMYAAGICYGR